MFSTYNRLNLHVNATNMEVIRAAKKKFHKDAFCRTYRAARHAFYKDMLEHHFRAKVLFCA